VSDLIHGGAFRGRSRLLEVRASMPYNRSVVITGLGAVSAAGIGVSALWDAARAGVAHAGPITRFDASQCSSRIAAECSQFDRLCKDSSWGDRTRDDRFTLFALAAANEAVRQAELLTTDFSRYRAGVFMGTAIGGVSFMENVFRTVCERANGKPKWVSVKPEEVNPHIYRGFLAHAASNEIAETYGFCGLCSTMTTGCTAGLDSIGAAADAISCGMADVMIAGGVDCPITPTVVAAFDVIHCLTRRNESPTKASRPFDRGRDGFLLAEGCGIVILEEEQHARRRRANILARILGVASRSNAFHMTSLPADGEELAKTLLLAIKNASISPEDVDYINAHGSSTQQNDRNETAAFKHVFGQRAYSIPVNSTKSVIGHSLGAASALETIVCVCSLIHGLVHPTVNYEEPSPDCDLDYVPRVARRLPLRIVACNASSFSGIHSAAIFAHADYRPHYLPVNYKQ
jgi:3-oxoacyl-(acyl-carrier-protein) synthase